MDLWNESLEYATVDCGMEQRNCGIVFLELGCKIWSIQKLRMKGDPPAVVRAYATMNAKIRI